MVLNDLSFQLFFIDAPEGNEDPLFLDINTKVDRDTFLMINESVLKIAFISNSIRLLIIKSAIAREKSKIIEYSCDIFSQFFKVHLGRSPFDFELQLYKNNLENNPICKIENYTFKDQENAFVKTITELFLKGYIV